MQDHQAIATERAEIRKLTAHFEGKQPVEWVRVHALPDFIYFSHKRHVKGGVDCRECHGDVQRMEEATQVSSLEMGFCLACHERLGASKDCLTCHH